MREQKGGSVTCLSCGINLEFKSAASSCMICSTCQTIHYQNNQSYQIKSSTLKKFEPVQEDMSVIRLGSTGVYQDSAFEVIGRVQYFFQERYRNHWFLTYNLESGGWLGDWDGNYSLFQKVEVVRSKFENPTPGKKIQINQIEYFTEQIDISRKVFAEGELGDFYFTSEKFITLELFNTSAELALAHVFSDKKVEVFTGHYLDLSELNLQNLRQHDGWA